MTLPRDFLDELEGELRNARAACEHDHSVLAALEELCLLSRSVALDLLRPVTVFEVLDAAPDPDERERRARLVRLIRGETLG